MGYFHAREDSTILWKTCSIFYFKLIFPEAATQRCSYEKVFRKYVANLQEDTHAEVQSNFIEITLRHGCSPVNLLHIFKTPFPRNTSGWLLLFFFSTLNYANKKYQNVFFPTTWLTSFYKSIKWQYKKDTRTVRQENYCERHISE